MPRFLAPLAAVLLSLAPTLLGAGREVAPRPVDPTPYTTHLPSSAFAGERFLTVWFEQRAGIGSAIVGAFSDRDGRRVTAEAFPLVEASLNHYLQAVGTGDSYAIFWRDRFGGTQLAEVDLDGRVIGRATVQLPQSITLRIGWNGTYFLAAMKHPAGFAHTTEAVLFDRAGRIVRLGIPLNDLAFSFDIVPHPDGFTVLATGWDGLSVHRISHDGTATSTLLERAQGTSSTAYRPQRAAGVARPDGSVLVVWSAAANNQPADLKSTVLGESAVHVLPAANVTPVHLSERLTLAVSGDRTLATMQLNEDGSFRTTTPQRPIDLNGLPGNAASHGEVILVPFTAGSPAGIPRVHAAALTATETRGPELLSLARGRQAQPIAGSSGAAFLTAWTEQNGDPRSVRTAMLDALGEPSNVRTLQEHAFLATRDLPWNGSEFLVTMVSGTTLLARRVAFDGTPVEAPLIILTADLHANEFLPPASVTWAGDRWAVVWTGREGLLFATISRSGEASMPQKLAVDAPLQPDWSRSHGPPAIAYDAPRLLVVWSETTYPPCFFPICEEGPGKSWAALLDREGRLLDPQPLALPFGERRQTFSVASSGREFLIVANGADRAVVLQASGNALRIASTAKLNHPASDVAWDGTSFVLATRFRSDFRWFAGITRVDRRGVEVAPLRVVRTLPPEYFGLASVASGPVGTILAVQETDLASGARVVIYCDDQLGPFTPEPSAPRRRSVR